MTGRETTGVGPWSHCSIKGCTHWAQTGQTVCHDHDEASREATRPCTNPDAHPMHGNDDEGVCPGRENAGRQATVLCAIPGHHDHDYRDCPTLNDDAFDVCPEPTCPLYGKAVMADHPHLDTPAARRRRERQSAGRETTAQEVILRVLTEELPGWDGDYPVYYDGLAAKILDALDAYMSPPARETSPGGDRGR